MLKCNKVIVKQSYSKINESNCLGGEEGTQVLLSHMLCCLVIFLLFHLLFIQLLQFMFSLFQCFLQELHLVGVVLMSLINPELLNKQRVTSYLFSLSFMRCFSYLILSAFTLFSSIVSYFFSLMTSLIFLDSKRLSCLIFSVLYSLRDRFIREVLCLSSLILKIAFFLFSISQCSTLAFIIFYIVSILVIIWASLILSIWLRISMPCFSALSASCQIW